MSLMNTPEPPEILWHYTNWDGAMGILRGHAKEVVMWLTHTNYLNDLAEMKLGIQQLRAAASARVRNSDARKAVLNAIDTGLDLDLCVASLSSEADHVPQWREYCRPGPGIALGFDSKLLRTAAWESGAQLVNCVYTDAEREALIGGYVGAIDSKAGPEPTERHGGYHHELTLNLKPFWMGFRAQVSTLVAQIKDAGFDSEHEWRLATLPQSYIVPRQFRGPWKVRRREGLPIPYRELSLGTHVKSPLRRIMIGPGPYPDETERVLRLLLQDSDPMPTIERSVRTLRG